VYDEFYISTYNMLYTSAPVVMLGALEQDVTPGTAVRYPGLYQPGLHRIWFSRKFFARYAIHGLATSLVLIGIIMGKERLVTPLGVLHALCSLCTVQRVLLFIYCFLCI
jgi:magnesium-transporting ATPase (P-type)